MTTYQVRLGVLCRAAEVVPMLSRWLTLGLPASPGPGAYAPAIGKMPKVSASSHVFLSNVHRLGTKSKRVKPPGPGALPWLDPHQHLATHDCCVAGAHAHGHVPLHSVLQTNARSKEIVPAERVKAVGLSATLWVNCHSVTLAWAHRKCLRLVSWLHDAPTVVPARAIP